MFIYAVNTSSPRCMRGMSFHWHTMMVIPVNTFF